MKDKILNILIIAFVGFLVFCTYYTTILKYQLMPTVTVISMHDGTIKSEDGVSKTYHNVIPKSCLTKENGDTEIFVVHQHNSVLGSTLYVQKIHVRLEASDNINCSITNLTQISENMVGVVKSTTGRLEDMTEINEKLN